MLATVSFALFLVLPACEMSRELPGRRETYQSANKYTVKFAARRMLTGGRIGYTVFYWINGQRGTKKYNRKYKKK